MGRAGKIARRSFLTGSVAIAGGVAFGVWRLRQPLPNPLQPAEGQNVLTPYVLIDADGVAIIAPRAEMGQSVQTTLAAMVAEELDIDWQQVRILHGPAAKAYFNGALVAASMPWRDFDEGAFKRRIKSASFVLPRVMGMQVTGGSTSTIDGFDKMRAAGAAARQVLLQAAATRLGVAPERLATKDGAVIAPGGERLPYHTLAEAAALIQPPREPQLKDPASWRYLGTSMARKDIPAKSTGTAAYGIDTRLPDMRFAALRISPRLGARMLSYDATAAQDMTGVEKIVPLDNGIGVIARNTWLAFQALDAIDITWAEAPYPPDSAAQFARIAAAFDDKANSRLRDEGDAAAVLETTPEAEILRAEYRVPFLAHTTMEPMNATVLVEAGKATLWAGNQAPLSQRSAVAAVLGLAEEKVTVHTPFLGGGFGRRFESDYSRYAALMAAAMPGVPVKTTWSREEDLRHDYYRPAAIARFSAALDGKAVRALDGAVAAPSVVRASMSRSGLDIPGGPDKGMVEGLFDQPYAFDNIRISGHIADLSVPIGFWRSVGASHNGFFHESFMDEMAHATGRDPLEFRLAHMRDLDPPSRRVLEKVADMSDWGAPRAPDTGKGVAFTHSFGTPVAEVVEVTDTPDGIRLGRAWIAADVGTVLDPDNARTQLISGMIYGLSAAMFGEITFAGGEVEQWNFPDYDALRMAQVPEFTVEVLGDKPHISGIGEVATPPSMAALANALFDLTGKRARRLPLSADFDFV